MSVLRDTNSRRVGLSLRKQDNSSQIAAASRRPRLNAHDET